MLELAIQIADALDAAHAEVIVHREPAAAQGREGHEGPPLPTAATANELLTSRGALR